MHSEFNLFFMNALLTCSDIPSYFNEMLRILEPMPFACHLFCIVTNMSLQLRKYINGKLVPIWKLPRMS